jgi:outer membrane protein OmpA-like peptidoglycan-associated protein
VDISPSARFCITEAQIITALYQGIERLKTAEDEAGGAAAAAAAAARVREQAAAKANLAEDRARAAEASAAQAKAAEEAVKAAHSAEDLVADAEKLASAAAAEVAERRRKQVQTEINAALTEEIPFIRNKAVMTEAGPAVLHNVASVLCKYPFVHILIDGHAKGDKNTAYLQKLSDRRANAVMTELAAQGA